MAIKRQIFYSFHYDKDVFRVQQIRNIGSLEDNQPVSVNEWEEVKKKGIAAIEKWIDENMKFRSCIVVLVGEETHQRPWVRHEIKKAWNDGKGLLGIQIHNFKCMKTIKDNPFSTGKSNQGTNPFTTFNVGNRLLSEYVHCYNPNPYDPYNDVKNNLESWIETAIKQRASF